MGYTWPEHRSVFPLDNIVKKLGSKASPISTTLPTEYGVQLWHASRPCLIVAAWGLDLSHWGEIIVILRDSASKDGVPVAQ